MASSFSLASRLQYAVPQIKLCMVHENFDQANLYRLRKISDVDLYLAPLRHATEEHFVSLHLNARQDIIGLHEVSHGSLVSSVVHPREVFKAAIAANSFSIIVCHNHPSGARVEPSDEDIEITYRLLKAGKTLCVPVIDHVILSPNQPLYSIRENMPEIWDFGA
ncbi:MAG: hypothetical protein K2Y22_16510 [Candidatus Obscuribacterales bacterium]|nr:hypothetical protein [Candidatus Obscuribacterales bacterium]